MFVYTSVWKWCRLDRTMREEKFCRVATSVHGCCWYNCESTSVPPSLITSSCLLPLSFQKRDSGRSLSNTHTHTHIQSLTIPAPTPTLTAFSSRHSLSSPHPHVSTYPTLLFPFYLLPKSRHHVATLCRRAVYNFYKSGIYGCCKTDTHYEARDYQLCVCTYIYKCVCVCWLLQKVKEEIKGRRGMKTSKRETKSQEKVCIYIAI